MNEIHNKLEAKEIVAESLNVRRLTVSAEGGPVLLAEGDENGVGLWLTQDDCHVCICAGFNQGVQVSIRSSGHNHPHDLSLHANSEDGAGIQIVDRKTGGMILLSTGELLELLADRVQPSITKPIAAGMPPNA